MATGQMQSCIFLQGSAKHSCMFEFSLLRKWLTDISNESNYLLLNLAGTFLLYPNNIKVTKLLIDFIFTLLSPLHNATMARDDKEFIAGRQRERGRNRLI